MKRAFKMKQQKCFPLFLKGNICSEQKKIAAAVLRNYRASQFDLL